MQHKYYVGNEDKSKIFDFDSVMHDELMDNFESPSDYLHHEILKIINTVDYYPNPVFFRSCEMIEFNFFKCNNGNDTKIIAYVEGDINPNAETFYLYSYQNNIFENVIIKK